MAVAHVDDAVAEGGDFRVVGNQEDGLAEAMVEFSEHIEDQLGVFGVEAAGGFVGQENLGAVDDGARNGDALLLASGKLIGPMVHARLQAEQLDHGVHLGARGSVAVPGDVARQGDVAIGGEGGEQIKSLEDEADFLLAQFRSLPFAHLPEVHSIEEDPAGGGRRQAADHIEERGFAAARRSYQAHEFSVLHAKVDPPQGRDLHLPDAENLMEIFDPNDFGHS